jgi:microcystin-dependent protein
VADYFVGQILLVPFTFAPNGFAFCNGQLMLINFNTALYSLLGTMYGGDGNTTFALPDLRGRAALAFGQGPGLSNYQQGGTGGSDAVTLVTTELPAHTHAITNSLTLTARARSTTGNQSTPVGAVPASEPATAAATYSSAAADANMGAGSIVLGGTASAAAAGGSQSHANLQPYLTLHYVIALQGFYPLR